MLNYCSWCVQPDTRPGIVFKNGICPACLYEEEKKTIDWDSRLEELRAIAAEANRCSKNYDCVVGVSGGKDSIFQALYARDELDLRVLLVNSEPEAITPIGVRNIENLINLGFDCIKLRPNPIVMKKLMRRDFFKYLNPIKVTEYSLYASTGIIADKFDIPLIIQGENPGLVLGDSGIIGGDAFQIYKANTLKDDWRIYLDSAEVKDLFMFHYSVNDLKAKGCKAIWLQYYLRDWSPRHNYEFSKAHGLTIREEGCEGEIGTYVLYSQLDNDFVPVNQLLKFIKFGFGQCTDHACWDIRAGRITREEAFELIDKYDGKCAEKYIEGLRNYLGITEKEFWDTVEKIWKEDNG